MALVFGCGAWCEIVAAGGLGPAGLEHWTAIAGTPSILTSGDWPGGKAYRCAASGAAVSLTRTRTFTAGRVGTARMRVSTMPGAERIIFRCTTATGTIDITITSGGQLKAGVTGGTFQTGPTVTNTQVFRLGWKIVTNATTWTIDWEVDGVGQTQATRGTMTSGNSTAIALGAIEASTYTVDVTDVVEATNVNEYPLADGYIKGVYINGDGTHNVAAGSFRDSGGTAITGATTNANTFVDDITPIGSGTDYLEQQADDGTAYLEFTLGTRAEPQAPMAVFVTGSVAEASASGAAGFVALVNGSLHFLSDDVYAQVGTTKQDFTCAFSAPIGTATDRDTPWFGTYTWPLARLRWGFSTDASPDIRLHGIVVEGWYPNVTSGLSLVLVGPHDAIDGNRTSVSWTVPAGVTTDDVMYAFLAKDYVNEAITAPGSWTVVGTRTDASSVETGVLYRKIAGGSEPTTVYTWSWATTIEGQLHPFVVRQSTPASPPEIANAQQANASSTVLDVPALTATAQDMMEVMLVGLNRDGTTVNFLPPGWIHMDAGGTIGTTAISSFVSIMYRHRSAANPPANSITVANSAVSVGFHMAIGLVGAGGDGFVFVAVIG